MVEAFYWFSFKYLHYMLLPGHHTLTLPHLSPGGSPTKSADTSPTGSTKIRPRAKSVDTDPAKRLVTIYFNIYIRMIQFS